MLEERGVPAEHIEALKQARESFVRKRRSMVEQMIPAGVAVSTSPQPLLIFRMRLRPWSGRLLTE